MAKDSFLTILVRHKLNKGKQIQILTTSPWSAEVGDSTNTHTHTQTSTSPHTGLCVFLIEASKGQLGWPMLLQSVISVFDQRATGIWPPRPDRQAAVNTGSSL